MATTDRPQGYTGWKWSAGSLLAQFQNTTFFTASASAVTHALVSTFTAGLRIGTGATTAGVFGLGTPE